MDTLDISHLCVLQPFLFSAPFMRALQPPSLRQLHQHCYDVSEPHPMPPLGLRRPKGLCPPPEPSVHAIILHTHATHATACRIWAKCTCSHDICAAFANLGEEEEVEVAGQDDGAAKMAGVEVDDASGALQGDDGASAHVHLDKGGHNDTSGDRTDDACQGVSCESNAVSWVDLLDSVKACVMMSQACMDSMLEHAAHLENTSSHCESVCGSSGDLGSDLDRHAVKMLLDASEGIATAGARAAFESVAWLADSECSSQLEYLTMSLTEGSAHGEFSQHPPDTLLYRVCLLYTSPSPRDRQKSRMPSSA